MTIRRNTRLLAALTIISLVLIALPGTVLGHAELSTVTPTDTSTVVGSPAEILMTFTENLDPGRSTIRLVNAAGAVVAEGGSVDPGDDVRTMRLAVPADLAPGAYTIRWTSFSTEDNEQDRGTTTFTVAAATPPPSAPPSIGPSILPSASPSAASVAPSGVPSPTPSAPPTSPTASASDALIPIIVAVLAIIGLGLWLARGRSSRRA